MNTNASRSFAAVLLRLALGAALAAACEPSIPQQASPASVVTGVFDPVTGDIPLPNDLALQPSSAPLPAAQKELLAAFAAQGGFPNDQEVAVTISFTQQNIAADGTVTSVAPDLDVGSFTPATLLVFLKTASAAGPVQLDPIAAGDYVKGTTKGTLTLHNKGRAPWTPGHYVVAVRGGPNGVKTRDGAAVYASQTFFLIAQGEELNTEANLGLLRAQAGSTAEAQKLAAQLDLLIGLYKTQGAFAAVDQVFPHQEMAAMTTFAIAPLQTVVQLDPGRGLVPLPIDLLRDPRPASATCAACGKLTAVAACTLAGGKLNAQGQCSSAAAAGFAALDGFSTTAHILSPTSDLLQASTITPKTVQLYDLGRPDAQGNRPAPVLVNPATYLTEPCEVTSSCTDHANALTPVIALQPAGGTAFDNTGSPLPSVFRTAPLKDANDYAVLISDSVLDKAGKALAPGTVARVLQFKNPLVDAAGKSQLIGIDDATAFSLEVMRKNLAPALALAAAAPNTKLGAGHVAMAYTFRTQTIVSQAVGLGALPYSGLPVSATPTAVASLSATAAFQKYGVKTTVPHSHVSEVLETTIETWDLLDPASGAFKSDPKTGVARSIPALIATPSLADGSAAAHPPLCSGPLAALGGLGVHCAPMVIFRHGLGGGRANMLTVADTLVSQGFVVVAIDAAKHGDRSSCTSGQINATGTAIPQCSGGAVCATPLPPGAQGDANPPGSCGSAGFTYRAVSPECTANPPSCSWTGGEGIPVVSSNYLITANFFRTRDTFRQDFIDESQLVRALAFAPSGAPPTGHPVFDHMVGTGIVIDPRFVYYVGQSLGAIQGAGDVATNPRISKAVLNVGGGTSVDVFTNSPAFQAGVSALLASVGITPGTSAYLQFLVVAKTILDPAEPINFVGHLSANTLPNLLAPSVPADAKGNQLPKAVLTQMAFCDQVVPNPFGFLYDTNAVGLSQMPPLWPTPPATGTFELFFTNTGGVPDLTSCGSGPVPAGAVSHAFFTDWTDVAATTQGQADAAKFLFDGTLPPSLQVVP